MTIGLLAIIGCVVASPLLWFGVSFLCAKIPFMADFLSKIFWEVLGGVPCFQVGAKMLETILSSPDFSGSIFFLAFLEMLFTNIIDSFVMGLSVFVFKALFARFSRQGLLIIPGGWTATALGVAFGAMMTIGGSVMPGAFEGIFTFILCVGLLCLGMGLMLGKRIRDHYARERNWAIAGMLMKILVDANLAWTSVALAVAFLEGPRVVQSTGNIKVWVAWYGATILAYFLLDSVIFFMSPNLRNSI